VNSRCWPRTVNVSPRTSRNAHPPFLQAFEGTPGRLPPGGLFYARKKVVLLVFGAPYPRRGAMVVPSGIAQAPQAGPATHHRWAAFDGARSSASQHACLTPGRSHLAIPGQIGPSRHHHCPAHLAAEPPRVRRTVRTILRSGVCGVESPKEHRDRVGPFRTVFGQGWPNVEPCMFNTDEQLRLSTSYRGGRLSLEAVLTDLVCRVAPRLITNLEEYQEAGLAGLRIARSRQYQVRGRGTGGYCGIDVDARGRV
jgi:hypothetical protein